MIFLPPEAKGVLDESYEQRFKRRKYAVTLPCKDLHADRIPTSVEIERTGDMLITCPTCGKQHFLHWSPISERSKWHQ